MLMDPLSRRRIIGCGRPWAIAFPAFLVFFGLVLYMFNPSDGHRFYPPCIFNRLTGLYCPGCGSTRAVYHLVHLDLLKAWAQNPLVVIVLPYLFYHFIRYEVKELTGKELPSIRGKSIFLLFTVAGVLLFWFARNLPFEPFCRLAPG